MQEELSSLTTCIAKWIQRAIRVRGIPRRLGAAGLISQKCCLSQSRGGSSCGCCQLFLQPLAAFVVGEAGAGSAWGREPGSGCSERKGLNGGKWAVGRCCVRLTVSFAWVLLFMSVASEGGSCSVPRPEVRGGGSCGLRDALIKLASQCCLNIVDNSVKFLFTMICFSKLRFFDSLLFKETMWHLWEACKKSSFFSSQW